MTEIKIIKGDLTSQAVDAIVNAANKTLMGGGGVDGAIHKGAGQELLKECKTLGGCETGKVKITKGYHLPAKFVIHTVGPVYGQEEGREEELLTACYRNSLLLAKKYNLKTIAFPAISTGAYGFPKEEAAKIALQTIKDFVDQDDFLEEIRLVLFSDGDFKLYKRVFGK